MSKTIVKRNGKILFRDDKVASGLSCCCPGCPEYCNRTVTVNIKINEYIPASPCSYFSNQLVMSMPGNDSDSVGDSFDTNPNTSGWLSTLGDVACGNFGPDGELGWLIMVGICWICYDPTGGGLQIPTPGEGAVISKFFPINESHICPDCGEYDWDPDPTDEIPVQLGFFGTATLIIS